MVLDTRGHVSHDSNNLSTLGSFLAVSRTQKPRRMGWKLLT